MSEVLNKLTKERDRLYLSALKLVANSPRQNKIRQQIEHVNKLIAEYKKTPGSKTKKTTLTESANCKRVKGYKKPTTGKRVKTYARKKTR
jgi:hypothetical protein